MRIHICLTGILAAACHAIVASPTDKEVWISPNGPQTTSTVNATPSGPYRCPNAASLATVLASLTSNTTIHLMPGTFQVTNAIKVKPGWKLRGAGIDNTILQLVSNNTNYGALPPFVLWSGANARADGAEISDLTVDCNLQGQTKPNIKQGAVNLYGSNLILSRVKAINWGTTDATSNGEMEVITFSAAGGPTIATTNCIVEDCIVTSPAPGVTQANTVDAIACYSIATEVLMQDNLVAAFTPTNYQLLAYAPMGTNFIVTDNRALDLPTTGSRGFYDDTTGVLVDGIFQGNVFQNLGWCIDFNEIPSDINGAIMQNNVFRPVSNGNEFHFWESNSSVATNFIVAGNVAFPMPGATNVWGVSLATSRGRNLGLQILNNILQGSSPASDAYASPRRLSLTLFTNNFNLSGGGIPTP